MRNESDLDHWLGQRKSIVEQLRSLLIDGRRTVSKGVDTTEDEVKRLRASLAEHEAIVAELRARNR